MDFVDETTGVVEGPEDGDSSQNEQEESSLLLQASDFVAQQVPASEEPIGTQREVTTSNRTPDLEQGLLSPALLSHFSNNQPRALQNASSPTYEALRELGRAQHYVVPEPSISPSQLSQSWMSNQWPLQSEEEAMLLRFFLDHISKFVSSTQPTCRPQGG